MSEILESIDSESHDGKLSRELSAKGEFAPDDLVFRALEAELQGCLKDGWGHFILDGFSRNLPQAEWLLTQRAHPKVFEINLDLETRIGRIMNSKERQAKGRKDDNPETIRERDRIYNVRTVPMLDFFRQNDPASVIQIDGTLEVGEKVKVMADTLGLPFNVSRKMLKAREVFAVEQSMVA